MKSPTKPSATDADAKAYARQLDQLRAWIANFDSALVAYSGGVDSSLIMAVAHEQLGDKALGCIGVSPSYPTREMRQAAEQAKQLGAPYRLVDTEEYLNDDYLANDGSRCFHCKTELYSRLRQLAADEGWAVVLDGSNAGDLGDDRPGMQAAENQGVRSPLIELGIDKAGVRALAAMMNVPAFDKPAMACLSSRVPRGSTITPELLRKIEAAEDVLFALGYRQFRVRHHDDIARIELPRDLFDRAVAEQDGIVAGVRAAGYKFVCLDLAGFREDDDASRVTAAISLTVGLTSERNA